MSITDSISDNSPVSYNPFSTKEYIGNRMIVCLNQFQKEGNYKRKWQEYMSILFGLLPISPTKIFAFSFLIQRKPSPSFPYVEEKFWMPYRTHQWCLPSSVIRCVLVKLTKVWNSDTSAKSTKLITCSFSLLRCKGQLQRQSRHNQASQWQILGSWKWGLRPLLQLHP